MIISKGVAIVTITSFVVVLITLVIIIRIDTEKFEIPELSSEPNEKTVWTYWDSSPPPKLVQKCIHNWFNVGKVKDVRVLNDKNIVKYIPKDEYKRIRKHSENAAVRSDFIAFYLLSNYGGTWVDGSIFMNKPLFDWLPTTDKYFCYTADRFSHVTPCLETFFMYSPKGHPISTKWYDMLHEGGKQGKEKFITKVKKEYPKIDELMPEGHYLWVYVVGKYMMLKNPELKNSLLTKSAEEGPWYEAEHQGWENIKQICDELKKKKPCTNCPITKLHNGMRAECGVEVVP